MIWGDGVGGFEELSPDQTHNFCFFTSSEEKNMYWDIVGIVSKRQLS